MKDHTTNLDNFVEYPIRLLKFVLKKLKIRKLFEHFVHDPRTRADHFDLVSLLMHGLAPHMFRQCSKNTFACHLKKPQASRAVAHFVGSSGEKSPSVRTVDDLLIGLDPKELQGVLPAIFRRLCRQKTFQLHPELIPHGEYAIAIDGQVTHVYHENSQHPCQSCPYCLKRTRAGKVWYLHYELVASFVASNGLQIPLLFHRIKARSKWSNLSEGKWKQECERTAFVPLVKELRDQFPRLKLSVLLDALYATQQVLTLLEELKIGYCIVRKAKVLKSVGKDCEGLRALACPLKIHTEKGRFDIQQTLYFFNDIAYHGHLLQLIQMDEVAHKKPSKRLAKVESKTIHWEWFVHHILNAKNICLSAAQSRLRWKQEDLFNDLQCRGFSIKHDFNRAPTAQSVRIYLILIAYAICSILIHSQLGQRILNTGLAVCFLMQQMLEDLIRLNFDSLFDGYQPFQLRFGKDPPYSQTS